MRFLIALIVLSQVFSCKASNMIARDEMIGESYEPGSCYLSLRVESDIDIVDASRMRIQKRKEKQFVLKVIPPKYEEVKVKYSCKELKAKINSKGYLMHETLKAHTKFVIRETDLSKFTILKNPYGYAFCLVEVPSQRMAIYKDQLKGDTLIIVEKRLKSESKIIKTYVKRKPKKLKENEFYFRKGSWMVPKKIIVGPVCGGNFTVKDIQLKLNENGYSVAKTNIMNQETKDALLDFQRKNGLKEGQLDLKTLEKLGVIGSANSEKEKPTAQKQ